jgi:hypothetical protein
MASDGEGVDPTSDQISKLVSVSGAQNLTEDVPVLFATSSTEEATFLISLRTAFRTQVGDASLLPQVPQTPAARIVVIDSAPDAPSGRIVPGVSRHGDTLAHLIEDIVCQPSGRPCAAEVTTALALPWIARGVPGPSGGYIGAPADIARAITRAVEQWQVDRIKAPVSTPQRLILNLSLGWEDTPGIADCSTVFSDQTKPPARAVQLALQYAASQGALIIAAAGNDSGGPHPRTGLTCPGLYQAVPRDSDPSQSLLVAASGIDYQDHPLETTRRLGITGITGLGLGGVAWGTSDPIPPPLTGSSVATAVVSAVSAVVWAYQPSWTPGQVTRAVYDGGKDLGVAANACPLLFGTCNSHRVSVCGALHKAGLPSSCSPPVPQVWSCPNLSSEVAALDATYAGVRVVADTPASSPLPRYLEPTVQVEPHVFPQPVSTTCRTCIYATGPHLDLLLEGSVLYSPVVVVQFTGGTDASMALGPQLAAGPHSFSLPWTSSVRSAYLTGFNGFGGEVMYSVTEQIFVQQ